MAAAAIVLPRGGLPRLVGPDRDALRPVVRGSSPPRSAIAAGARDANAAMSSREANPRPDGHVFKGLERSSGGIAADIPAEWLKKMAEKYLTEEEKKQIEAMGGLDKLLETLKKRLAEQKSRHQGGSKWIGPPDLALRHYGYNPEGVRIGQARAALPRGQGVGQARVQGSRRRGRVGTRNIKVALRRLRSSRAPARRKNSISTAPSRAPRTKATSIF